MQLVGDYEAAISAAPLRPFDDGVMDFFDSLSKALATVRGHSDVATFGFWCRKGSLQKEKGRYDDLHLRLGKGVVFHSTPSNVPVNFAFSFAAGLLAGNANIVRLPGKDYEQARIITDAVKKLLDGGYARLAPYACFVKYPPDKGLHDKFSSVCDARVVWGGDGTIYELRQSPLKPRSSEIPFADRYSIAIIDADAYLDAENKRQIARDFYNDTYYSDQNACTAPRLVVWTGCNKEAAKRIFWGGVRAMAEEEYELAPVQAVGKLAALYKAAASLRASAAGGFDPYVTRVGVECLSEGLMQYRHSSGFFFECDIGALHELLPVCGERLQTLAYYGVKKEGIADFIAEHRPKGIDRVVPMGRTMDFSLTWDGCDLIRQLSRKIVVI